ncbi:hypothetical protein DFH27DRAFT_641567 [Peziza echinospora]|nr:hypothetical protein DFH27DRAFT_641567 [Peziza echinospora]
MRINMRFNPATGASQFTLDKLITFIVIFFVFGVSAAPVNYSSKKQEAVPASLIMPTSCTVLGELVHYDGCLVRALSGRILPQIFVKRGITQTAAQNAVSNQIGNSPSQNIVKREMVDAAAGPDTLEVLEIAETPAAPRSKMALFIQGFKNFFRAMKDWFKSADKGEIFRNLGRRFAAWWQGIKAKFTGRKVQPVVNVAVSDGTASVVNTAGAIEVPLKAVGKTWKDMQQETLDNMERAAKKGDAEELAQTLDSEMDGLFEDEDLGPAMPGLLLKEKERQKAVAAGQAAPEPVEGPPAGNLKIILDGKGEQELNRLQRFSDSGDLKPQMAPFVKTGLRKNPEDVSPVEAVFLEQKVDPTDLSYADQRNYQILFEWFKDKKRPHDVTHPLHDALYDPKSAKLSTGTDAQRMEEHYAQQEAPVPIPYLREANKNLPVEQKLGWLMSYGLTSSDPNRPRWWWNEMSAFNRDKEVDDWIDKNIPKAWMQSHFPLPVGPEIKHHYDNNIPPSTKKEFASTLNELAKSAADAQNFRTAKMVQGDAMQDAAWNAIGTGKSQRAATAAIPEAKVLAADLDKLKDLRAKTYQKEEAFYRLKEAQRQMDREEDRRLARLREKGVHVVDVKDLNQGQMRQGTAWGQSGGKAT